MEIAREILPSGAAHTDDWYATRAQGIGGSDIASIVGAGYRSAYAIWLDKTQPDTRDSTGNLQMRRGNALEPIVASEFDAERSEEHTSELQSRCHIVCRLLLEKKLSSLYFILFDCPFAYSLKLFRKFLVTNMSLFLLSYFINSVIIIYFTHCNTTIDNISCLIF